MKSRCHILCLTFHQTDWNHYTHQPWLYVHIVSYHFICIKFIFCLIYIYKEAFERSWRRERLSEGRERFPSRSVLRTKKKPKWTNPFKYSTRLAFMTTKSSTKLAVAGKFTKFSRRSYMQWTRWKCWKHFIAEYELINLLDHDNIIKTYGIFLSDDRRPSSIILEFCPENMEPKINSKSAMKVFIAFSIYQIAEAMKYVHFRKIIHRDLKPSNMKYQRLVSSKSETEKRQKYQMTSLHMHDACWSFKPKDRPSFDEIINLMMKNNFKIVDLPDSELKKVSKLIDNHRMRLPKYWNSVFK